MYVNIYIFFLLNDPPFFVLRKDALVVSFFVSWKDPSQSCISSVLLFLQEERESVGSFHFINIHPLIVLFLARVDN
jgi:hypothetical protein